jgi:N-acetylneuraminic acid mutarotase
VASRVRLTLMAVLLLVAVSTATASPGTTCATPGTAAPSGCWHEILRPGNGGFPPAPGSQNKPLWEPGKYPLTLNPHHAFNNELWMTAQTHSYSSPDGLTWAQHGKTDWGARIYHSIVYFKGKLWMYGGMEYQTRGFRNDIWSSSDGMTWAKVGTAAWPRRGGQTMVVYRDQLWLFGGASHATEGRSTDEFLNDAWVSDDGLAWTEVTHAAPWPPRDGAGVLVSTDTLYLVGGQGRADVWRSSNGRDWTRLVSNAAWNPRHDYGRVVFDGKLWVFGGWSGKPTNALNDVWYSSDGITWNRQAEHAPWAPRDPIAMVYQDKIWIYSGKHTGGRDSWGGDLWQMTATTQNRP